MPLSASAFRPHLEYAERRGIRLVSYDRPGYYPSTARPGRKVGDCEMELDGIIDALGLERFGVWGWSAGGPLALGVAARAPSRVPAVALLGTVAPTDSPGLDWYGQMGKLNAVEFRSAQLGPSALSRFLSPQRRELVTARPSDLRSAWRSILSGIDLRALSGEFGEFFLHALQEGLRRSIAGWRDDDLALINAWGFDCAEVTADTLLLHGEDDWFVSPSHSRSLARQMPHARVRVVPHEGHLSLFAHRLPEVFDWLVSKL